MNKQVEIIYPKVLIISNKYDFACDYISDILSSIGIPFLRLNTDDLKNINISMDPFNSVVSGSFQDFSFVIHPERLKSIYFRGPVFLREIGTNNYTTEEQISRTQWATFIRSFMIFEECKWINHPMYIYRAENKVYQLRMAKRVGFKVPNTIITNDSSALKNIKDLDANLVLKGIDAVLINIDNEHRGFVYSNLVKKQNLLDANLSAAPVTIQQAIEPKIDIRVTVIGSTLFAVLIQKDNRGIIGDWRLEKQSVKYTPIELPEEVKESCFSLLKELNLFYGAIDLAKYDDEYYFLEINPTGEWAWLVEKTCLKIDVAIASFLTGW